MRRKLARQLATALWLTAATAMTVGGCATPTTGADGDQTPDKVAVTGTPAGQENEELTAAQPDPAISKAPGDNEPGLAAPRAEQAAPLAVLGGGAGTMALDEGKMGRATGAVRSRKKVAAKPMSRMREAKPMSIAGPPPTVSGERPDSAEQYENHGVNPMTDTASDRHSTFSVDVDTASYAIARRKIVEGTRPSQAAVRVEEWVNYFKYNYAGPTNGQPFAVHMDAAPSPFVRGRHLLRIGVQAKRLSNSERKPVHLVFLVDVSGSMNSPDKLGLAKRALRILIDNLRDGDTVALVTYASGSRVVLPPTGLEHKHVIMSSLEDLSAGGSTAMSKGVDLAYDLAAKNLSSDSVSRVIVLSDGDANVGSTTHDQILKQIAGRAKEGVTLSTIGLGMGNYKDHLMEQLADKGNGNYYYIDGLNQAKRVFQEQLGGTLEVVAKDVKIQVEFNPKAVARYRLVGYENRDIADADFRNDRVDAGEIGAGHTVTALYELELTDGDTSESLATVRLRAKKPRGTKAAESAHLFNRSQLASTFDGASADFRFAVAVMAGAEILRASPHAAEWSLDNVIQIASGAAAPTSAERHEFIELMTRAKRTQLAAR